MDFRIKNDRTEEILAKSDEAIRTAMEVIAQKAESNAKLEITKKVYDQPEAKSGYIRTGRLRNSITGESDDRTAQVGTNVEYAIYVETGTTKMPERPFIKPAIADHTDEYMEIRKRLLQSI